MRKTYTTTIEEAIQKNFKIACMQNDAKMNDILEEFMKKYISGEIKIELNEK